MSNNQSTHEKASRLRDSLGQYPTGVAIVTARGAKGELVGMTINSFSSVSLSPPLLSWCIDKRAASYGVFSQAEHFAITVLAQNQTELATRFATRGSDKFAGIDIKRQNAPVIPEGCAWFQCKTFRRLTLGDHLMMVGVVVAHKRYARPPMVFHNGGFQQIELPDARRLAA